jgi:hypothetical protein
MKKQPIFFLCFLAISISAIFTSCKDDSDEDSSLSSLSNVMVVNATPGSPGYDFYINDALQNSNAINYTGSSAYIQTIAGSKNLKLNKTNTAENVINLDENFELGGNYTLLSIDTVGSIESIVLNDDLTEPILGKSHVRVVHASHNSPAVDIINLADSSVVFSNIGFRQTTAFTPLNAGSYALGYRLPADTNIVSLSTPVTLSNRGIYTIVLSGFNSDTTGTPVSSLDIQFIDNVQ